MAKKKASSDASSDTDQEQQFESALGELESIVAKLEQGSGPLENALEDYAKAIQLMKICHSRLEDAERKIEVLSGFDAEGNPMTRPFEGNDDSGQQHTPRKKVKKKPDQSDGLFD